MALCFRDMTFCSTPHCTCQRALTPEVLAQAFRWWGSEEAPIGMSLFHGDGGLTEEQEAQYWADTFSKAQTLWRKGND